MEEGNPEKVVQSFLDQVPLPEKKEEFETGGPIIQMEGVKNITTPLKEELSKQWMVLISQ